jgi:hypothetical protein
MSQSDAERHARFMRSLSRGVQHQERPLTLYELGWRGGGRLPLAPQKPRLSPRGWFSIFRRLREWFK